jgi:hypothetical protein
VSDVDVTSHRRGIDRSNFIDLQLVATTYRNSGVAEFDRIGLGFGLLRGQPKAAPAKQ